MSRSRIAYDSPQKLFPGHSKVATGVARLCVLREDIYLELAGLAAKDLSETTGSESCKFGLDDNGVAYRRLYFFRASLTTLAEIQETVHTLQSIAEFRTLLKTVDTSISDKVNAYHSRLNEHLTELRRVRNALGGHVSQEAVEKALSNVRLLHETGKFEMGKTERETHFGFANTICAHVLIGHLPKNETKKYVETIAALNEDTMEVISIILTLYLEANGYFRK